MFDMITQTELQLYPSLCLEFREDVMCIEDAVSYFITMNHDFMIIREYKKIAP